MSDADIPSWAVRGSKVICIEDGWDEPTNRINDPAGFLRFPERGKLYTIREVRVRFVTEWNEVMVGFTLEEIRNPICEGGSATGEEAGFHISAFRPLVSTAAQQEADASLFRHHLDQIPVGEDA